MSTSTFQILTLLIIVGFVAIGASAAYEEGATPERVTDEPVTVDYDVESSVAVDGLSYNESVSIEANGVTLTAGVDYSWNAETGNVTWFNTTATSDGDSGTIDYTAQTTTDESKGLATIGTIFAVALALLALLAAGWGAIGSVVG